MNIHTEIQVAIKHYQDGNFQQAEKICRNILEHYPDNFDLLYFYGMINYQLNNYDSAIEYIKYALQIVPNNADAYYNLGNAFRKKAYLDQAIACYQKAIQLTPTFFEAHHNLGMIYLDKGQITIAIDHFQIAIKANPHLQDAYYNLGYAFQEIGRSDEAIACYQKALRLNPNDTEAYDNLGTAFHEIGQHDEAISCFQRAIQINPNFIDAYRNLGNALLSLGKNDDALSVHDNALKRDPDNIIIRWAHCMAQLFIIYQDQASIEISRNRYRDELLKLRDSLFLLTADNIEAAVKAVSTANPFFLAYQGLNDRELQQIYGDLVYQIMAERYPQFAIPLTMPPKSSDEPIRIGLVSGFFHNHSVWKIPVKGWVEQLNKQPFALYGYYTGKKKDQMTVIARPCFRRFVEDIYSFENLCQIIRDDNLHILIYSDIGMDPITLKLAALRLSPIQCSTALGHPETSGLPTIDYCFSSDMMEPVNACDHYRERLIRLPNLSAYYTPPQIQSAEIVRDTFGLRPNSILYLCCQSLFKYLPKYDEVYPRIAQNVDNCQFLFISHEYSSITDQFRLRLRGAFSKFDLNVDDYIVFLPRLSSEQYRAINYLSDIFLDSIGWSGCNTSLEAIECNLPIVTLPGEFMRGRHSMAILEIMEVRGTIAKTLDDYIDIAVKLGQDIIWRKQLSNDIARNKHRVFRDYACISALEEILNGIVKENLH